MNIFQNIHAVDVQTFSWCMARKHRAILTRIGRAISFSADGPIYALLALLFWFAGEQILTLVLVCGFLIERALYLLLKRMLEPKYY